MDLERTSVVIRQRITAEAIDLGVVLGRHFWKSSFVGALALGLPIFLIANAALATEPWLALVVVWWAKPLLERVPLAVVSRGFFGEERRALDHLRTLRWPPLGEVLAQLSVRRFSPWRSYLAPVEQLEEQWGAQRNARVASIARQHTLAATGTTFLCLTLEMALWGGVYVWVALLTPPELDVIIGVPDYFSSGFSWELILSNALVFVAALAVMPFYVAAGFSLYIKRRIDLEAWDIDLAFRRLSARLEREKKRPATQATTP